MNELDPSSKPPASAGTPLSAGRIWRITRKELRETLRDRRTIITLLLMPLLVYPLLSLAFRQFLLSSYAQPGEITWSIGVLRDDDYPLLNPLLRQGESILQSLPPDQAPRRPMSDFLPDQNAPEMRKITIGRLNWFVAPPGGDLQQLLLNREIDLGMKVIREEHGQLIFPVRVEILSRPDSAASMEALHFFEQRFRALNEYTLKERLKLAGANFSPVVDFSLREAEPDSPYKFPMATLLPLILILMTITGAVYPAIDLTAGERERGTLESLVASPMSRFAILIGKYIAVLTVAVLTALMNITAMTITLHSTGLSMILFGNEGFSPWTILAVFGLMVLFAAFFSAVLLAVTSIARSFKEAQAYLIPLMLVAMTPGFLSVNNVKLEGWWSVTPLANMVLLARDVMEKGPDPGWAIVALASTFVYGLTALVIAAQLFGNDAILYGSQDSWEDWMLRPKRVMNHPTVGAAFLTLALIFPFFIWLSGQVGLRQSLSMSQKIVGNAIVEAILFLGIPLAIIYWRNISLRQTFQLRRFHPLALVGAVLIGFSMIPTAAALVQLTEWLRLSPNLPELKLKIAELAREIVAKVPFSVVLISFGIIPPLVEELYFRGFFFTGLQPPKERRTTTVLLSAIFFGLFHVFTGTGVHVEKLFSTTAIGGVLGWIALRSRSIWPSLAAHIVHNSLIVVLQYYGDRLPGMRREVPIEMQVLPWPWYAVTGCGLIVGGLLVWWSTRDRREDNEA